MSKLKNCKTCGKEVAKSAKVCVHCGQKLKLGFMKKALIGVGVLFLIGILANIGKDDKPASTTTGATPASTGSSASSTPAAPKQDTPKAEAPKQEAPKQLSNEGVSSDVTIKVGKVQSKDKVGNEFVSEKASGVYKIVEISLTNNQKDAITADSNSFKLVDSKGREFTYSVEGQMAFDMSTENKSFFLKQLNPGLTETSNIVFDIPKDATGLTLKATGGMMGEEIILKVD